MRILKASSDKAGPLIPPMVVNKNAKGFTLLEAVIALSIWMILSVSVIFIWQFTSDRTDALIARQGVFENARGAMDVLIMNLQMAQSIRLEVGPDGYVLRRLVLRQRDPQGQWPRDRDGYIFTYNHNLTSGSVRRNRLEFGANEFASGIATIRMELISDRRMHIIIVTECKCLFIPLTLEDCDCLYPPVILEGSVDVRYKVLYPIQRLTR